MGCLLEMGVLVVHWEGVWRAIGIGVVVVVIDCWYAVGMWYGVCGGD